MKVLILSTYRNAGGAAVAASRLLHALQNQGVEATMLCRRNLSWWPGKPQSWESIIERMVIWAQNGFSLRDLWTRDIALFGQDVTRHPDYADADVIHLHWTNQGFISLATLQKIVCSGKKVVITMHDMWWCSASRHTPDIPDRGDYSRKAEIYRKGDIDFVTVSSWLRDIAAATPLMQGQRISIIPNTISLQDFPLRDKSQCRRMLGISAGRLVVTICASKVDDPVKDFPMLISALQVLCSMHPEWQQRLLLRIIGSVSDATILDTLPVECDLLGRLTSTADISCQYGAADIVVSTSTYETFGQTIIEAMASGAVPVAFGNSGQRDIIRHLANGYLVDKRTPEAFAQGMAWALTEGRYIPRTELHEEVARKYSEESVARQYLAIYSQS